MADEVGTYVLPVIASFEGIDRQVNSKLSKAFGATGKMAGAEMAKGAAEGMKALEASVKKSSDAIAKSRDKEAAAADKVATAEARIEEVRAKGGSALKRAEAQRNAANRAQLAALRDIENQTRSLERAQKSLDEAQADANRSGAQSGAGFLTGMRGSLAGAGSVGSEAASSFAEGFAGSSALLSLGSRGGPIGLALAAAGTVAGGLLVQNVLAGIEREPARDLIQARLRLDDASMAEVGRSAAKAYVNNFGDTVQDNLNAGQLAIQGGLVSGAMDPDLNNVIEKLQAINQYVEGDLAQTTKSASVLLRSGLAGSAEEAFDIIAAGYSMTGDLGGDFLDSIGEYSSGWKNAGLNATQALALIKQGSELGVDVTDRSADALREFGRRVSENGDDIVAVLDNIGLDGESMFEKFKQGGEAGFEAFDQVFDRIRAIEDPTRRNQAAMALLGDTAGDFIDAFTQWDPSAAVSNFGSVEGAAQNAADTMGNNVAGSFESAKRSIEVSLDAVQDKLAEAFGPTLIDAAKVVQDNTGNIRQFFVTTGEIALSVGAEIIDTVGGITEAAGQLVGGIGNIQGTVLKFEAWQADLRGDGELAEELRRQSEEAYGWGDALEASGTSMRATADEMRTWKDRLRDTTTDTDDAATATSWFGRSISDVGTAIDGLPSTLPSWFTGPATGQPGGLPILAPGSDPFAIPGGAPSGMPGPLAGLTPGGGGSGVGINLQIAAGRMPGMPGGLGNTLGAAGSGSVRKVGSDTGLLPQTVAVKDQISTSFGNITDIGGYRANDPYPDHPSGRAIDVMIPNWNTAAGKAQGDQVAQMALQNPNVQYVLWQQKQWNSDGTSSAMSDRGSPTQNHMDHVHVYTYGDAKGAHPTGTPPTVNTSGAGATALSGSTGSLNFPATATSPQAAALSSAFGPQFEAGKGTPGYNEYGEPGYYETDPRTIAQAERRAQDAQQNIADADQRIADAKAARAELEKDLTATAEERARADRDVLDAEKAAGRAREDATWAAQDAEEAKRGRFTAAKEAKKSTTSQSGGMGGLGEIGSIFGSFLKETTGIDGSFLPDISSFDSVQSVGALLGAFAGPLQGLVDGQLGIQQPGWSPGMPVPGMETSSGAFGMPSVAVPPMPAPGQHPGTGAAPGPAGNTTIIDQSVHGNVGSSPAELFKARDQGLARAVPRMPAR